MDKKDCTSTNMIPLAISCEDEDIWVNLQMERIYSQLCDHVKRLSKTKCITKKS